MRPRRNKEWDKPRRSIRARGAVITHDGVRVRRRFGVRNLKAPRLLRGALMRPAKPYKPKRKPKPGPPKLTPGP